VIEIKRTIPLPGKQSIYLEEALQRNDLGKYSNRKIAIKKRFNTIIWYNKY